MIFPNTRVFLSAALGVDLGCEADLIEIIMNIVDTDRSGTIDFIEFLSYIPFFHKVHSFLLEYPLEGGERPGLVEKVRNMAANP